MTASTGKRLIKFTNAFIGMCLLTIAPAIANPFFAFDNGVGRNLAWPPMKQATVLKQLGYDGIGYTGTENFTERQRAFAEQGLRIFNLYVTCFVDKTESYDPQLKETIKLLKDKDVDLWITVQGNAPDDANAVRVVQEIADEAAKAGVRVVLYPHKGFFVATADDAMRILRAANRPNLGLSINLCHELAAGNANRMDVIVQACAAHLFLVSINGADSAGGWSELIRPLGEGNFDVPRFLKSLGAAGYKGPIGLQCYMIPGAPEDHLKRSINNWKEISGTLKDPTGNVNGTSPRSGTFFQVH
ncbi:MAG: sugar phosphate isomerase/epimerase [Gloeobacteraceae cyanobacterium ES-bin-144]|nr:sugar phosphate isomerase/epimerase [Verrucomicrobiales bacterium]